MTDKDPKDMTVSELLRKADSHPCSMCHLVMTGDESCATTGCASWAYRLADKIDAELAEARELSLRQGAELWAKANGWPDFKDGEGVKRPAPEVLGADGLPIKVGDAMWSLSGAGPLTVTSLHTDDPTPDGGDSPWADLNDDGLYSWIYAGSLTHTPPDTQQDIDEDATMPPAEYCAVRGIDLGDDPDRATATEAMVRDLLRRQRELDKQRGVAE